MPIVSPDLLRTAPDGTYDGRESIAAEIRAESVGLWRRICADGRCSRAVLLVGPPGSGKSTWLAANERPGVAYYDATLTWPQTREQLTRIAKDAGLAVELVVFETPLAVCLERNASRPTGRRVPEDQVLRQWQELRDSPPRAHDWLRISRAT